MNDTQICFKVLHLVVWFSIDRFFPTSTYNPFDEPLIEQEWDKHDTFEITHLLTSDMFV